MRNSAAQSGKFHSGIFFQKPKVDSDREISTLHDCIYVNSKNSKFIISRFFENKIYHRVEEKNLYRNQLLDFEKKIRNGKFFNLKKYSAAEFRILGVPNIYVI